SPTCSLRELAAFDVARTCRFHDAVRPLRGGPSTERRRLSFPTGNRNASLQAYKSMILSRRRQSPVCAAQSHARAVADQKAVVGVFRGLPPQILLAAEREDRVEHLLEVRIGRRDLVIEIERGL